MNRPGLDLRRLFCKYNSNLTTNDLRAQPLLTDLLERQLAAVRTLSGVNAVAYANQGPVYRGVLVATYLIPMIRTGRTCLQSRPIMFRLIFLLH